MYLENFNYSILGNNTQQRIVFVHGLMAFSANWRKIANLLSGQYQCLIYDQRGHGRSFKPELGYSPEILAEDLNNIISELGWEQFHLVGHSLGARVAMVFSDKYPEKIQSLTIEDMGPDVVVDAYKYYEGMLSVVPTPFDSKEEVKRFFSEDFLKLFQPKEEPQVLTLFLQSNIEEKPDGKFDWRFLKSAMIQLVKESHQKERWAEIRSFQMPVLLVRGEKSKVLSEDVYLKMLESNSNIKGIVFKQTGHWIHYEKYAEFAEVLRSFIGQSTGQLHK